MNLVIEYLIRTDAIRAFLKIPCSLCLDHWNNKCVVVVLEESPDSFDSIKVTHWTLDSDVSKEISVIPKEDVFSHHKVILGDHKLLKYKGNPLPSKSNSFRAPMDEFLFDHYNRNFLNSESNLQNRINWLWMSFKRIYRIHIPSAFGRINHVRERHIVKDRMSVRWDSWINWKSKMLVNSSTATEIIFHSSYAKKNSSSFLYYPWT